MIMPIQARTDPKVLLPYPPMQTLKDYMCKPNGSLAYLAKLHLSYGLDAANFLCVMPVPGTRLFERAVEGGYLDADIDPDLMNWTKASMRNTVVPADGGDEAARE